MAPEIGLYVVVLVVIKNMFGECCTLLCSDCVVIALGIEEYCWGVGVEISVVFPLLKTNLGCNSLIFLEPLCNLVFECCYGVQICIYFLV